MEGNVDDKTPELNNPTTYVLTDDRFITYLPLIFRDLDETQIYETQYRNSAHH